tara:strand:- start:13 stop:333 length:321 start_codon:yes stop_codon:yes gene_type:complete
MKYSEKIQASKEIINAMESMTTEQRLVVEYPLRGDLKQFRIVKHEPILESDEEYRLSINGQFEGMNIDKVGKTTMNGYTYDLMSQRTSYTFKLYEFNIVEVKDSKS